jgi:putative methionine-R-sulfoxide reductase with GAF domain
MQPDSHEQQLRQLSLLIEVSSLINSTLDPEVVRERTIEALTRLLDVEGGALLLVDEESGALYFESAIGEKGGILRHVTLEKGEGIAGWVAEKREAVILNDPRSDPRFSRKADLCSGFTTRNIACVPVISRGRLVGVLEAVNRRGGGFSDGDLALMNPLANQVAVAIENARLYRELKETFHTTIQTLAETIELRDPYTGGHTRRVMTYSLAIGRRMGLAADGLERLRLAAVLHDLGKIGIRDEILLKAAPLDDEERLTMSRHAHLGAHMLSSVRQFREVTPGVRGHHERYDGKGYPDGLANGRIPVEARIIAVADSYDAMVTDRPYRKGLKTEDALAELRRCAKKQFDPEVVESFVAAWTEGELADGSPGSPS